MTRRRISNCASTNAVYIRTLLKHVTVALWPMLKVHVLPYSIVRACAWCERSSVQDFLGVRVFSIDLQWKITSFNKRAEQLTGFKKEQTIGKYCWQVFQSGQCRLECPFTKIFDKDGPCKTKEMTMVNQNGLIKTFNVAAEGIFGYRAEEVKGEDVTILMAEEMRPKHTAGLSRRMKTGEQRVDKNGTEVIGRRKDNKKHAN